jgi:hypothetical protein
LAVEVDGMLRELAGFAVLSLWILVPLGILLVGVIAVCVAAVLQRTRWKRWVASLTAALVVVLIPTWDEIAGGLYFNHLCETQAGVKIYQTVELPAEYWDERGRPKFYDEGNGNFNLEGYGIEYKTGVRSSLLHIDDAGYRRIDKRSGEILGEVVDFRYWGGWVARNLSLHNTAIRCDGGAERSISLIKQIFRTNHFPAHTSLERMLRVLGPTRALP